MCEISGAEIHRASDHENLDMLLDSEGENSLWRAEIGDTSPICPDYPLMCTLPK